MLKIIKLLIAFAIFGFVVYQGVGLFIQLRERIRAKKKAAQSSLDNDTAQNQNSQKGGDNEK